MVRLAKAIGTAALRCADFSKSDDAPVAAMRAAVQAVAILANLKDFEALVENLPKTSGSIMLVT